VLNEIESIRDSGRRIWGVSEIRGTTCRTGLGKLTFAHENL
jgi:hypothetical protein